MYLYIFDDFTVKYSKFVPDAYDLQNVDDGFLNIINISDPERPMQYDQGSWFLIDSAN
ncbi:MAG: hypothetical protein HQ521_06075 [Bacteroidetes bacterium]|nr:hypothetical protein [Bacteroidota bacterium]